MYPNSPKGGVWIQVLLHFIFRTVEYCLSEEQHCFDVRVRLFNQLVTAACHLKSAKPGKAHVWLAR